MGNRCLKCINCLHAVFLQKRALKLLRLARPFAQFKELSKVQRNLRECSYFLRPSFSINKIKSIKAFSATREIFRPIFRARSKISFSIDMVTFTFKYTTFYTFSYHCLRVLRIYILNKGTSEIIRGQKFWRLKIEWK